MTTDTPILTFEAPCEPGAHHALVEVRASDLPFPYCIALQLWNTLHTQEPST